MKYIDVMKSVVTMKLSKIVIFAITLFCMFCAETVHASARTYGTGEKLYFRQYPSDWSWFGNDLGTGNHVFAYFYNGGSNAWSNEATVYISGILQVTVPSGTWTNVIFTRQSGTTPDWSRVYDGNQSEDIPLNTLTNYIQNFRQKNTSGEGWHWVSTSSAPTADMTMMDGLTCETINVCQQSIDNGDVYSLAPILNGSKTDYDYEGDHIWLKWVSGHWMPVSNDWSNSDVLLEDVADNYYLLWTSIGKSTKRIVHLKRTDCEISCQITSFEYVLTPVNVNDSTFAIEGIIAFTQTAGDLVISYGDSVQRFASPTSPQVFSLQGLRADGTTKTLRAQFEGVGGWTADSTVTAPLPDAGVEIYDSETDDVHYSETGSTYIHNKSIVLRPSVAVTDSFAWTDPNGKVCKSSRTGGDNTFTVADYMQDTTIIMYYTEFNAPPMAESNMMGNGSYETTTSADEDVSTSAYKKTSGYKYTGVWGGVNSKYDVYDNGYGSENGLFGVTTNPHVFWHRMAHIEPKDGLYMAVFDGDNEEQIAWQASTADNENLVLQKGTTYMFSFWVANVNNYGEMIDMGKKNNAILQFKIKYKDKDDVIHEAFLGEATDLNNDEYFDNLWHQNSATFTSDYDADDVTISVVDKNTSGMRIGNDFALDDIRFRAISVQSGTIRARERFEVKFEEPKTNPVNLQVEWVTKPACGQDTCTMRVSFRYPNITAHDIKLTLKDLNIAGTYGTLVENLTLAKTPIAGNPDSTDYVAYFTSGTYAGATYNSKVKADAAAHNFKAQLIVRDAKDIDHGGYTNATLDAIAIPALTITKADIASPSCSGTTYNLSVDVKYTAQSGTTLRYYIDDVSKATRSIDYNVTERSLANVEIFGLTADGKEHTLKVTTGHILDCIATQVFTAPKANTINSFDVEPNQPDCDVDTYSLRATWEIAKQEGGEYDALMIKVGTADPYEITITSANASGENAYFDIPIAYNVGDEHPTIIAYMKERGVSCKESASYVDPIVPRMTIGVPTFEDIECNESTFDLVVPVTYTYQHGKMWAWIDDKTSEKIEITATGNCKTGGSYTGYLAESASSRTTFIVFDNVTLSGDHKVSVECDGEHSCHRTKALGTARDFTAPVLPFVDRVFKSYSTPDCNVPYTTLTFDFKYANQPEGVIEMWVDDDKTAGHMITLASASGGYTPAAALKTLENQKITFVPADSLDTHVLHIKSGRCDEIFTLPRAPFMPKVEDVSVSWPATLTCGESSTYSATVTVTSSNYRNATLCVSLNDGTPQEKNPNSGSQTFTFSGLNADGGDNTVKAWFKCAGESCNQTKAFTSPTLPLAALVTPVSMPTIAACDVPTFDLTFDLKYTYQDGELQVWVDDDKKGYTTFAASETAGVGKYLKLNKSEQTKTITLSGLPSDGGTTHKLYYKFDKSGYCNNTASPFALTAFPRSPTITNVSDPVVPTKVADCTVENYIATIEVEYQYTDGEEIVIAYTDKNGDSQTFGPVALAGSPQTIQIRKWDSETSKWVGVLDDIGKGAKSLEVYFQKSPVDFSSCHHSATYTAPSKSSINSGYVVTIDNKSTCGNRKYNLSGTITFSDDATDDLIISFPGVRDTTIAKGDCDKTGTPFTMTGLTAETADKTFIAKFKDQPDCPAASKPLEAVDVPGFDVANMSFTTPACDEITTTLKFDLSYTYQSGTKLYVWVDSGTKKEIAFEANKNNEITISGIEIPGVSADGVAHTLHVEFVGGRCPADEFTTPAAPFSGKISNIQTPSISDEECGLNTYSVSVTFDVSANSAGHKVIATCKGKSGEKVVASGTNTINISGIVRSTPDEADDVVIELYFYDNDNCDPRHSITFGENPFKPIPTFSLDPIGAKCYPATSFDVTYEHTNANKLYYKVTQGETTKKDWTEVTVDATKTFTISTSGWADGAYTVEAYVKSAVGCESATPHPTVTLTINKQPSLELASIDDACAGKSSVSTTVTLKDGATKYDYDVFKNDEVMSAQHKSGQTSSSISLSTSTWEPATYKIQVTAYSSVDCPSDPEEVSFVINPNPDIEVLTASQTICEEEDAVSYDFTITGAKTYSYSVVGTDIAETGITVPDGGSGTISFNPSELSDGYYALQVIAKSELGCTTTRTAALKISNKPTVSLTATTNICYLDPAGLDFKYTVSADAKTYYLYLWQADRSQKYGGCGNFDLPTMNEGTIHYDSFSPYGSPLSGGDYVAVMWVKNSAGCVSDSVVVPFTIYPIAGIEIYTVASMCATKPLSTVFYNIHSAKSFRYKIDGVTEWSGPQTPSTEDLKHFEFKISDLSAGTYTLQLQAYNDNCGYSNIVESPFTIYPLPTLNLDVTAAGINVCYPVAQVDIPYTSTDAKEYTYVLTGGGYNKTDTKSASASGKIEVNTDGLPAGDYALSVTAVSEHDCEIAAAQTTTIHINPRPTFTFNEGEVRDCHPSTSINVGYTSTNAKTYSYTLTLEGESSSALAEDNQPAVADGEIPLNTTGLAAGTYDLVVTATSKDGCDMLASVSRKVIIQAKPTVSIESVESHCAGNASINVSYKTTDATTYYYEVLGTELKGHADAEGEGSFTIDISNLEPGNYTLRMKATAGQCESATDDEQFVIYPIPTVSFVTPAPIKEGVANVTVTLNLTDATKYDWRFIDKDGSTELESSADVPAGTTTVTLTTGALDEGTYSLFVTPKTSHCTGEEREVHIVVNNKPTINFTAPEIVCAGTSSLSVPYSPSPDATDLYYTIKKGSETVVAEQHVDITATSSPLAVDISNLPYGTYTLTGYISSALESGDNSSVDFTLLAVPTINKVTQDVTFIGCDETYSAEIKVNIFNAAGRKIYAKYTDDGDHTLPVETSAGDPTATFHLTDLTHTDLSGKHEVKVYVDGFEDCGIIVGYDEPKLMTITEGFEVKPLPKSCGEEKFSLTGKVVANCNEGKIVVEYNDTYKTEVNASTGGSDFTIADIPAGGSVTQLKAYFQGKTCGVVESAVFTEPTKPEASIAYIPIVAPACDVTTFDLSFTLSYTYQEAGSLTIWVDDDHKSTFTSAGGDYQPLNTSAQPLNGTITGLPADGRTGQKLYFEFSGTHSCSGSIDLPVFPQTPLITGVSVTNVPLYIEGLEGTYSPTITVTYQKAVGERIVLEYLDKNNQSQLAYSTTTVAGDGTYTFDGLTFDDVTMGSRTLHAYFEGSACTSGGNHDGTYTAPTNSSITFESLTLVNTSTCEGLRYNLTGKVSFVGAVVSDLVVEFDATHQYVIPQSQCVAGKALEFAINGVSESIPDEGKTLSAYFSLIPGNVAYSEPVYEPLVPSLDAEIVRVDTIFTCGSKSYTVFLNITSENQRGACFVYDSIAGGTLRRVAKHDGTYNGTNEFTIAMPQRVEEHYIIVRYPITECVVRFAPISVNPYTKPQPEITLTPIERVCNTATELVLPFAITQGDIAEASLTLTDSKEQTIVSDAELTVNATKDTLTYTLSGQLSAGKHTLMVEVRDTLECVATATLPIELALDGQIYSKWNDVLLVDNSQGLYSAYQWYENGQPLSGKTDQVLYLPDGMNGTYTCLLTTAEGKLFTCEYEFEDIPRSADQQFSDNDITVLPNRVKAGGVVAVQQSQSETLRLILMSATGQRIGEYTQTDSKQLICMPAVQGVYLLRITSDSGLQTEKIVVY